MFQSDHKQTLSGWCKVGKNDVKFQIHGPFELESQFFYRNIKHNVLITYMKSFYENCMATLVAMATVHEIRAVIRQPSSPGRVSVQKLKSRGDAMQSQ